MRNGSWGALRRCVWRVCVTVSVTIGLGRDGQDGTGHDRIIEPYLARRADFTGKIANSTNRPMRFSRPQVTLVRKTSAFSISDSAPCGRADMQERGPIVGKPFATTRDLPDERPVNRAIRVGRRIGSSQFTPTISGVLFDGFGAPSRTGSLYPWRQVRTNPAATFRRSGCR